MNELLLYLGVFLGAATPFLEAWVAVSAGVAAGLPPLLTALIGFLGNALTLLPVIYAGGKLRAWFDRRRKQPQEELDGEPVTAKHRRKQKIMERFGVPGLALLGPFVIGVHAAAAFAITSGAGKQKVLVWFMASLAIGSLAFAYLAHFGVVNLVGEDALPFSD